MEIIYILMRKLEGEDYKYTNEVYRSEEGAIKAIKHNLEYGIYEEGYEKYKIKELILEN